MSLEPDQERKVRDSVLATVAYADIFDFAVSPEEVHRDLVSIGAARSVVDAAVRTAIEVGHLTQIQDYVTLAGREALVQRRIERNQASEQLWLMARAFGHILAALPFVRLVGVTGSLAADNASSDADIDYLIIVAPERVWLVRALAITIVRLARLRGVTLCPNYLLSMNALELPYRDLYTAHELLQMVPLSGPTAYAAFRAANRWTSVYLPNRSESERRVPDVGSMTSRVRVLGEHALARSLGCRLEDWESHRKIARFRAVGTPGRFSRDICEGHFGHHRDRVLTQWQVRCNRLGVAAPFDQSPPAVPDLISTSASSSRW